MTADLLAHLSENIIDPAKIAAGQIFISYSRQTRDFAKALYGKLDRMKFKLWQDVHGIEAGADDWWQQIQAAIDGCETMILVMSLPALKSPVVGDEWLYARKQGKRVIPVVAAEIWDDPEVKVGTVTLPNWMKRVNWLDFRVTAPDRDAAWANLIRTLNERYIPKHFVNMVEALPPDFVPRPNEFEPLINALVDATHGAVAISAALKGAGGFGKTTLARAVCHNDRVRGAFDDGILWVTIGEKIGEQDLINQLLDLCVKLTGSRPPVTGITAASDEFRKAVGDSYILLVIDDVWQSAHVRPFLNPGKNAATLITTRNSGVLPATAFRQDVDAMRSDEALALLRFGLPTDPSAALIDLTRRLGEWPLLMKLVNGALRKRIAGGESLSAAITWIGKALDRKGFGAFDNPDDPDQRHHAVSATLSVSLELLDTNQRAKYARLAIFPEDADVTLVTLEKLWAVDDFDVEEMCQRCADLSLLLKYDLKTRTVRLHDVVRTFLTDTHRIDMPAWNRAFLDNYHITDWQSLPRDEPYLWRNIAYHLIAADQADRLRALLLDYRFLRAKLEATDAGALSADCDALLKLGKNETIRLLRSAIVLSEAILVDDKDALGHQLVGRLMLHRAKNEEICTLTDSIPALQPGLYPIDFDSPYPTHTQAGGALLKTMFGHTSRVHGVHVLADGRLLSWSYDHTLRLWTADGTSMKEMRGHSDSVNGALALKDGRFLSWAGVSLNSVESKDHTLRLWTADGVAQSELIGHTNTVNGALELEDGRFLSWSDDNTLRLWASDGKALDVLKEHTSCVIGALRVDDGRFLSWSLDGTLRLWGADGTHLVKFTERSGPIIGALALKDGRFLSWGNRYIRSDRSIDINYPLHLWEADGTPGVELIGHTYHVDGALELKDGRILSWSWDGTQRLWAADGTLLISIPIHRHNSMMNGALELKDGRILSWAGNYDKNKCSLKLWTTEGKQLALMIGHTDYVIGALALDDGRFLSWGNDSTLRLWASDGEPLGVLARHCPVSGVLPLKDGRLLSWGYDGALRFWAADGTQLIELIGHESWVVGIRALVDGRFVTWNASDFEDETIRLWAANGTPLGVLAQREIGLMNGPAEAWAAQFGLSMAEIYPDEPEYNGAKMNVDRNRLTMDPLNERHTIARYYGDANFISAAIGVDDRMIVVGDEVGRVLFLRYRE